MKIKTLLSVTIALLACSGWAVAQYDHYYSLTNPQEYYSLKYTKNVVEVLENGAILTCGCASDMPMTGTDGAITLIDALGSVVWSNRYGRSGASECLTSIVMTDDGSEAIVTGWVAYTPQNSNMWAMKIDWTTGAVIWSNEYGDLTWNETGNAIISVDDLQDEYIIVGAAGNSNAQQRMYATRVTGGTGAQVWANLYVDSSASNEILPRNLDRNDNGDFMIIGDYFRGNISVTSTFTYPINPAGTPIAPLVYYAYGDTNTFGNDIDFTSTGSFITTYTTSYAGIQDYLTIMEIDVGQNLIWAKRYGIDSITLNYGVGIYENVGNATYDLFTDHSNPSTSLNAKGFLQVDMVGTPVLSQVYTPLNYGNGISMVRGANGYYSKGTANFGAVGLPGTFGYSMLGTDLNGVDVGYLCNVTYPFLDVNINPIAEVVAPSLIEHETLDTYNLAPVTLHGAYISCNQANSGVYKNDQVEVTESLLREPIKVYPTMLREGQKLTVEIEAREACWLQLSAYSTMGQLTHQERIQAAQGANLFSISPENLYPGINLLILRGPSGILESETKVFKE